MSTAATTTATSAATPAPSSRRWAALVFIALAQLMAALDATIVNVALPSAQHALRFSDSERQWVITAYTLAFAGLVLLGGRIADIAGRRRTFLVGLIGFAAASALAGTASSLTVLAVARGLQGACAALLAPTTLSLLATTFHEPAERAKAFAIYGAIAGSGAAVGLLLGGALTELASWRWCLYVNVPIAAVACVGARLTIPGTRPTGAGRIDVPGAVLSTGALVALVCACTQAVDHGWGSFVVVGLLVGAAALAACFVAVEARVAEPLLALAIVRDRRRAGASISVALAMAGMLGLFLFLTYYLQVVRGYSPLRTGLAFLPLSAAVQVGAMAIARPLLGRVGPRPLVTGGLLTAALAMALLTGLGGDTGYAAGVLPSALLLGVGMGCVFVPAITTATATVDRRHAGVASAVLTAAQQTGGSIGTALLNTIATTATAGYAATHHARLAAPVHGYTVAAAWATGILLVAAVLAAALLGGGRQK